MHAPHLLQPRNNNDDHNFVREIPSIWKWHYAPPVRRGSPAAKGLVAQPLERLLPVGFITKDKLSTCEVSGSAAQLDAIVFRRECA